MKIAFLGDIALVGQFCENSELDKKFGYLKSILLDYDYIVANLESPITNKAKTIVPKSIHLRTLPQNVLTLKYLGINAVTLANNHSYDYGRKGLEETISYLEKVGIKFYGIDGKDICEKIKGERINLSGYCCLSTNGAGYKYNGKKGINTLTRKAIEEQINNDKIKEAVSVISVHFGIEHTNYPSVEHISLFNHISNDHELIIHGHHPHQIQGIIRKERSLIAYSLGNAVFDKINTINGTYSLEMNEENRKSFVLGVEIARGKIIGYETRGFYIGNNGIRQYDITKELKTISARINAINDINSYIEMRKNQYQRVINIKFGKHDLNWIKSRMNYYSIGAKLLSKLYKKRYKKIKSEF